MTETIKIVEADGLKHAMNKDGKLCCICIGN